VRRRTGASLDLEDLEHLVAVVIDHFHGDPAGLGRGERAAPGAVERGPGGLVDLGIVTCIENDSTDLTTRGLADAAGPGPGAALFYLVRQNPPGSGLGYGFSSAHDTRRPASGDCL